MNVFSVRHGDLSLALLVLWVLASLVAFPAGAEVDLTKAFKIRGDSLSSATEVLVDGKRVEFKVLSDHELAIPTPDLSHSPVQISVVTPAGSVGFSYEVPKPSEAPVSPLLVSSITPESGGVSGGQETIIRGAGFRRRGLVVSFGGQPARSFNVNNDAMLTATVPAHSGGVVDIEVKAAGADAVVLKDGYAYIDAPAVAKVSPAVGPVTGGTKITIEGAHFSEQAGVKVFLGRIEAPEVKVKNGQSLEAVVPAAMEGKVDITVINPDGQLGELKGGFLYLPVPTIKSVGSSDP